MGLWKPSILVTASAVSAGLILLFAGGDSAELAAEPAGTQRIADVPHVRQKRDFCGEACLASWLGKLGASANQDDVFDLAGLDPTLGRGCYTKDLVASARRIGFDTGPVWHRFPADQIDEHLRALWTELRSDLAREIPSIICMRTGPGPDASEHFRLILGFDASRNEAIYHEPAADDGRYRRMPLADLFRLWPLKYDRDQWTVIRIALRIDGRPRIPVRSGFTDADYAQHIMTLRDRIPGSEFQIRVEPPFVVISDESPRRLTDRCEQTVRWATSRLKRQYFAKDPDRILDIWLFKDRHSYDTHTARIFGSKPSTPYGYYSATENALVMNIATGGGTLVHEIVHPFIESNFPACPAWFNEGLGSLYEQSASRDGRIVGLTNWRLAGLQRAIRRDVVPSFRQLCGTTTDQFYRADPGTNYAQARYLCYYLQQQQLLEEFYHQFVANHRTDPTGYQTLKQVLDADDMESFQEKWEAHVLKLSFP